MTGFPAMEGAADRGRSRPDWALGSKLFSETCRNFLSLLMCCWLFLSIYSYHVKNK